MRRTSDAYPFPALAPPLRFAIALAVVAVVFAGCWAAGDTIDDGSEFLLLGTAVMACAWFGGTGPALAATVLGALLGAFEASRSARVDAAAPTHLALFVVQGLVLTALISELRARSEEHTSELQSPKQISYAVFFLGDWSSDVCSDRKSTRLNSSHPSKSRMPYH